MTRETVPLTPQDISIYDVTKQFTGKVALDNVSLDIQSNELTVINGPSGSGKTTLLNVMSGIMRPDSGTVYFGYDEITTMPDDELTQFRACNGQAFQRSGLIAGLTARKNILYPHTMTGSPVDAPWTAYLCQRLDIVDVLDQPASELSGGQALRVSVARALAHRPGILFADEPTASLDTESKHHVHGILKTLTDEDELTVVMVSHDEISEAYADRVIRLQDGVVRSDTCA